MPIGLKAISVALPLSDLRRIPGKRREFIRQAVAEKLARESRPPWKPKTAIGRKLLKFKRHYLASGGKLLDADALADELRERRGDVACDRDV